MALGGDWGTGQTYPSGNIVAGLSRSLCDILSAWCTTGKPAAVQTIRSATGAAMP
jgi:hypothetical protein